MAKLTAFFLSILVVAFCATVSADDVPTSKTTFDRTVDWKKMNVHPFVGSHDEGCTLNGLTPKQCQEFKDELAAGRCETATLQDGTVLDSQVYSKNGVHYVRHGVRVAFGDVASEMRQAHVCPIGGGKTVVKPLGCANVSVVNAAPVIKITEGTPYGVTRRRTPSKFVGDTCEIGTGNRFIALSIYDAEAREKNACAASKILSDNGIIPRPKGATGRFDGNGLEDDRLSSACGDSLFQDEKDGKIGLGRMNHGVTVVALASLDATDESVLFKGAVEGRTLRPTAEFSGAVVNGSLIRVSAPKTSILEVQFEDYSTVVSPTPVVGLRVRVSDIRTDCLPLMLSGVERKMAVDAPAPTATTPSAEADGETHVASTP